MLLGWWITDRRYSVSQVCSVILVTVGAALTTLAVYLANADAASEAEATSSTNFLLGLLLLLLNLLNNSGLAVLQAWVFQRHGQHVEESVVMMTTIGAVFMLTVAGKDAISFGRVWF